MMNIMRNKKGDDKLFRKCLRVLYSSNKECINSTINYYELAKKSRRLSSTQLSILREVLRVVSSEYESLRYVRMKEYWQTTNI